MGIFDRFMKNIDPEEELKGIIKAQEMLDERFKKKEVSNETYKQKSLEFMLKKEKIQKKLDKVNN